MSAFRSFAESGGLEHAFIRGWMALLVAVIIVACGSEPPPPQSMDSPELLRPCLDEPTLNTDVLMAGKYRAQTHQVQDKKSDGASQCISIQNRPLEEGGIRITLPAEALSDSQGIPFQVPEDVIITSWNLENEKELLAAPGLMEGVINPGDQPVGLESMGIAKVEIRQLKASTHSARPIGVRGHVPGSIRIGSQRSTGDSAPLGPTDNLLLHVPVWTLDEQSNRWLPTDDFAEIVETPTGYEWKVSTKKLPPVFNVALPFWWRSDLASAEEPLNAPDPAWVERCTIPRPVPGPPLRP